MPKPHRERVFLIRMWQSHDLAGTWRGSVRDVASGTTFYVLGPREMADCVSEALAVSAPAERPSAGEAPHAGGTDRP